MLRNHNLRAIGDAALALLEGLVLNVVILGAATHSDALLQAARSVKFLIALG